MSARAVLLGRVRAALGGGGREPGSPPPVDEALLRLVSPGAEVIALFESRARKMEVEVSRASPATLAEDIEGFARALALSRVTLGLSPGPVADATRAGLAAAGVEVIDHRAQPGMAGHFEADAGITDAHAAIAESGTVVMGSDEHHPRGAYLAPPMHIVMLDEGRIVPDLLDLWPQRSAPGAMPAAMTLVTGPSKTADIEGILIKGVHGPGRVIVVILGVSSSASAPGSPRS